MPYGSPPSCRLHLSTRRGRRPMKLQRPTRWPCSADSSRNAGPSPRSFRNAETGVSQSSTNVWATGTRLWVSTPTAIEHRLRLGQIQAARAQQYGQVVEHVGGLLGDAIVGLLARGARDLLGLLHHLRADRGGLRQQRGGVGALGALGGTGGDGALERRPRPGRRGRLELAVVKAGALAGVAGRPGGLDQRQHGVAVAVEPQRLDRLRVARCRALVPQLAARAAPQVQLAGLPCARHRLLVHVRERQDLARAPVLDDAGHEPALVVGDVHGRGIVAVTRGWAWSRYHP